MDLDDLRRTYLCFRIVIGHGKLANKFGSGQRHLFVLDCDGELVTLTDTSGASRVKYPTRMLEGMEFVGIDGTVVPHRIDGKTGHLMIETPDGEVDYGPWAKKVRRKKQPKPDLDMDLW